MSNENRFDPLGLAELDSRLAPESAFPALIGLSASRIERIESRRAFVEMKQLFMSAVLDLAHRKGAWLRAQVRAAEDPVDLWLLRGPLLATLREDAVATRTLRAALYRSLDRTFPEAFGTPEINTATALRA